MKSGQSIRVKTVKNRTYYVARIQRDGRVYEKSLGSTETTKLSEAKRRLREALFELEQSRDSEKSSPTFGEVWSRAITEIGRVKQWKRADHEVAIRRRIAAHALKPLGHLQISEIATADIRSVLAPLWYQRNSIANALRQNLSMIFSWCLAQGMTRNADPARWKGNLEFFFPAPQKIHPTRHHTAPTMDELQLVVRKCREEKTPPARLILFIIATAGRRDECRLAKAEEIEGETWIMPAVRRKDGKPFPHRVPMSTLAKIALKGAPKQGYLFSLTKGRPMAMQTVRNYFHKIVGRSPTIHGIRSAFRDWAAREEIPEVLAEKSLSHVWGSTVTQSYLRDDLLEKRRDVMERWSSALLGTVLHQRQS